MHLEVVSPEAVLFSSKVDSISVPGTGGEFQMLNNHAAIVSTLKAGTVKIHVHTQEHLNLDDLHGKIVSQADDDKILTIAIQSGTIEMKDKIFSCNGNRGNKMHIHDSMDDIIVTIASREMRCELVMVLNADQIDEAIAHLTELRKAI